eukprot:12923951-Prorocentrum_lima.AAC.1
MIEIIGIPTDARNQAVLCLLPPVITDARLLASVADTCRLQEGQFWLEGPHSRPIVNWQGDREWHLTEGMQMK